VPLVGAALSLDDDGAVMLGDLLSGRPRPIGACEALPGSVQG